MVKKKKKKDLTLLPRYLRNFKPFITFKKYILNRRYLFIITRKNRCLSI